MGFSRKRPLNAEVGPKSYKDYSLAALRHAEISGIQQSRDDTIHQPRRAATTARVMALQPRQMTLPTLIPKACDLRIGQLVYDISEIGREASAGQTLYILENKGFRFCLAHDANGLLPHVAIIIVGAMFAP